MAKRGKGKGPGRYPGRPVKHDNIRARMAKLGMTQRELADRLGVTPQSVWNMLHRDSMSLDHADRVARCLGMDVSQVIGLPQMKRPRKKRASKK